MANKELKFSSAQQYLEFNPNDEFRFFFEDLLAYALGDQEKTSVLVSSLNLKQELKSIISDLFLIYDCLVIDFEGTQLLGEISGRRFFIRRGIR